MSGVAGPPVRGVKSWRHWTMPEALRNLLAINSMSCAKYPRTRNAKGLYLDLYRIGHRRKRGRAPVLGTFRVDNVSDEELVRQVQSFIHWSVT